MSETWTGASSTAWFTTGNWQTIATSGTHKGRAENAAAPAISATGTVSVLINGGGNQPVIPATETTITVNQTVYNNGTIESGFTSLSETQIGGEQITLNNGANLSIQGDALGIFYGSSKDTLTATNGTLTGLHGATSTIASYDSHMSIIATGTADTLTVEAINENFGLISIGTGDTLTIYNTYGNGANAQALHGLINYGLITVAAGGDLNIGAAAASGGTYANFYNAGWIEVDGGTLSISSSILDGSNTLAGAGTTDGYIEIGDGGDAILSNTVASAEEVTFTDTSANTLQITAGTLFSGTVNDFGGSDSIVVTGFTSTSNATITTVGGVTELITTNGSVLTTITLTGTTSSELTTSYNSVTGQETITGGGSTSYASGTTTDSGTNGTITNTSTVTVSGASTDLVLSSPVTGTGAYFIDNSATLTLDNTTGNDATQTVIFGVNGTPAAPNTLLINDGTAGFGGTVTSFGSGDDILLGGSTLPALTAGEGVVLNYNTTSHVLTITETNASGTAVATETLSITGTPALSTGSFIGLESSAGLNIELAATAATGYSFSATGTGSFESPGNFTGGVAPGDVLSANETVTITAGTASVSAATLTDNGTITIASGTGFIDAGTLSGTGTLAVGAGGKATLTGSTSLGAITDAGSLTLGGTVSGPITIASGGTAAVTGSLVDTGSISGAGALSLGTLTSATLTGGISAASIADAGSLVVAGAVTSTISGAGTLAVAGGTAASLTGGASVATITDSGALTVAGTVAGNISGTGTLAVATGTAATLSGTDSITTLADNGALTVTGSFTDSNAISGTGSLTVNGTASLTGNTALAFIVDNGKITLGGTDAASLTIASGAQATIASTFSDSAAITGAGTLTVNAGVTAALASGSSVATVADLGTLDLLGSFGGIINMQGNTANTAVDLNIGTAAVSLTNFGTTDKVILGTGAITQAGATGAELSYSGGVLTVTETSSSGATVGTDRVTIAGITNSTLSSSSFTALQGTAGVVIELASNLNGTGFAYAGTGTGSFEAPANYTGGIAPGDSLATGESVTIATGTASVSTSGVTDNGSIVVNSGAGFIDHGSLTGTGSLVVNGSASLTGGTSLASITDNGSLTLSGSVSAPVTLGTGAQLTLSGNFTDSAAISGPGTLTVDSGVSATLAAGSSFTAINNFGTLDVLGGTTTPIDMEGNAGSVVVLPSGGAVPVLTSFGNGDQIIVSGMTVPAGDGLVLSYNSLTGVLTGTETASNGSVIGTSSTTITGAAGNTFSTGSFIALEGPAGVTIELAPTVTASFAFSASGTGSFEAPADYTGGIAPGDALSANETVAVVGGTASVSSGGVNDNGLITIASGTGFIDAGSLSGTGALVVGAGGDATLTGATSLASITDAGSLTLAGTDAAAITLAAAGQVTLSGNFADSAAINGAGTLTVNTGVTATLASGSIASVFDAGTLDLTGSFGGAIDLHGNGAGSVVQFTGTGDVTGHTLDTTLTDLGYGDKIIIGTADFALNGTGDVLQESYSSSTGVLTVTDITSGASLNIDLGLTSGDPASYLTVSGSTGELTLTLCFYPGTALATPSGEIKVEDIKEGDLLMTANGAKPVRWIGQSHIHTGFADPLRSLPIRICQGALGDGLPVRDLLLSPDHAIAIGGILVQASALVNGSTIIRETQVPEQFTYYHVELDSHELLLAEGVQAESFVDNVDRMHFHNWDERTVPDTAIAEMDLPRAKSTRQVPMAIRRLLGLSRIAVA